MTIWELPNDEILAAFVTAREHSSTARSYRSRIRSALRRYKDAHGYEPALHNIVTDAELLGEMFTLDSSLTSSGRIARRTLGRTITAFRSLVAALPPPRLSVHELAATFEAARRAASSVNGLRLHLTAGTKSGGRSGWAPSADDISLVIGELRASALPFSAMSADVTAILYLAGPRVGAILDLVAGDIAFMPDGRVWVYVHEKARPDARPLLLRTDRRDILERFRRLSPEQSLWTNGDRQLSYDVFRRRLDWASARAGLPHIRPHDLRRAFASDVAARLGLGTTVRAGGWLVEQAAERYVSPRSLP